VTMGSRIMRNTVALGGAQAVSVLTGLVTTLVLARALGPESFGILGFGIALMSYFGLAVNLGMDSHAVREIAKAPAQARAVAGLVLSNRLVLAGLFVVLVFALSPSMGWSAETEAVVRVQSLGLLGTALVLDFYFQARQRMEVLAVRQVAASVAGMLAVLILIRDAGDLLTAAAIPVVMLIASGAMLFIYFRLIAKREAPAQGAVAIPRLAFIRRSVPVALVGVLVTVLINLDIVILGYLVDEAQLGLYVAAARILTVAAMVPGILHGVFLPALAEAMIDDTRRAKMAGNMVRVLAFLGAGVAGVGVILTPLVLQLLFGGAYDGAAGALRILLVHAAFLFLAAAYGTALLAWQCDRPYSVLLAIGAVLNVALNFLLIPRFGIEGAAYATLASQLVMWLGLMALARKAFDLRLAGVQVGALAAAAVSAVPAYLVLRNSPWDATETMLTACVAFVVFYLAASQFAGVVDLRRLQALLPARR